MIKWTLALYWYKNINDEFMINGKFSILCSGHLTIVIFIYTYHQRETLHNYHVSSSLTVYLWINYIYLTHVRLSRHRSAKLLNA